MGNLLKNSDAYYNDNDYYEIFSLAEDAEGKVTSYLKDISANKIVLDAGCGTGKFLKVLEKNANKYIGMDISDRQLAKAKLKSQNVNSQFICGDLSRIPLKDKSIDLIICTWVLGTIIDIDERNIVLNELYRVLKEDGMIVLVENGEDSEFEEIRGRTCDLRTTNYNNWILANGFTIDKKYDTFFKFSSTEEAKKCFNIIYGELTGSKVHSDRINHKILIFKK